MDSIEIRLQRFLAARWHWEEGREETNRGQDRVAGTDVKFIWRQIDPDVLQRIIANRWRWEEGKQESNG